MDKKTIRKIILAVVAILIPTVFVSYLIVTDLERLEQEEVTKFINSKKLIYEEYQDTVKELNNAKNKDAEIVKESLAFLQDISDIGTTYYELKAQAYEQHINKLEEDIVKTLNESYNSVLNNALESNKFNSYKEIYYLNYDDYINEENKELNEKVSEKYEEYKKEFNETVKKYSTYKPSDSTLREGMSKAQVRAILGSPSTIYKTDGGEIWVSGETVVMFDGQYAINVSRPLD